jgi:hypothetical protein
MQQSARRPNKVLKIPGAKVDAKYLDGSDEE